MGDWSSVKLQINDLLKPGVFNSTNVTKIKTALFSIIDQINVGSVDENDALWQPAEFYAKDVDPVFYRDKWLVSNIANNQGNEPINSSGVVHGSWRVVNASIGTGIVEWSVAIYARLLEVVFYDGSLYYLDRNVVGAGPFSSLDFETELVAEQWVLMAGNFQEILSSKADLVNGKVPAGQLPSYVDDVLEYADVPSFPAVGEAGKIYIALDTGKQYRWGGSAYAEVSPSDVNSVFGRTGVVAAKEADYEAFYPRFTQTYNDPSWINTLAAPKLTGTIAEPRLPYRTNQNTRTTDPVTFLGGTFNAQTGTDVFLTLRMGTGNSGSNNAGIKYQDSAGTEIFRTFLNNLGGQWYRIDSDIASNIFTAERTGKVTLGYGLDVKGIFNLGTGSTGYIYDAGHTSQILIGSDSSAFYLFRGNGTDTKQIQIGSNNSETRLFGQLISLRSSSEVLGNLTIASAVPKLLFTETDSNPDYSMRVSSGVFYWRDETNADDFVAINSTKIDIVRPAINLYGLTYMYNGTNPETSRVQSNASVGGYVSYQDVFSGNAYRGFVGFGSTLFTGGNSSQFGIRSNGALYFASNGGSVAGYFDTGQNLFVVGAGRFSGGIVSDGGANSLRRGFHGEYDGAAGSGTAWGSNIFSIGTAFDGSGSGTTYSTAGHYGISYLRGAHVSAIPSVGEGVYTFINGAIQGGIGSAGIYTIGTVSASGAIINGQLYATNTDYPVILGERVTNLTARRSAIAVKHRTTQSGTFQDGFGADFSFIIETATQAEQEIGIVGAIWDSANNGGAIVLNPFTGTDGMMVRKNMTNIGYSTNSPQTPANAGKLNVNGNGLFEGVLTSRGLTIQSVSGTLPWQIIAGSVSDELSFYSVTQGGTIFKFDEFGDVRATNDVYAATFIAGGYDSGDWNSTAAEVDAKAGNWDGAHTFSSTYNIANYYGTLDGRYSQKTDPVFTDTLQISSAVYPKLTLFDSGAASATDYIGFIEYKYGSTQAAKVGFMSSGTSDFEITNGYGIVKLHAVGDDVELVTTSGGNIKCETNGQGALLVPGGTETQRDSFTPVKKMIWFNDDTDKFQGYTGSAWVDLN